VLPDAIQLPRLGRLRERDYPPIHAKILAATLSEHAGHWYVSVLVEEERIAPAHTRPGVGVDLGVKLLATLSDGATEPNPRPVKACLRKIRRFQRAVPRRRKGSHNHHKAAQRLGGLHRRVATQRANTAHQFTSRLAKTRSTVVIEDLTVAGLLKNHH